MEWELKHMKVVLSVKWPVLTCLLFLIWQLLLTPLISSHTDIWVFTGIDLVVQLVAGLALVMHYLRHSLTKGQLAAGLVSVALMAFGAALLATSAPAGSVGDALLVMCGTAVWAALTLWVIIRALVQPRATLEASSYHF